MSEHAWTGVRTAAYVMGGLDEAERERLEEHVDQCVDCAGTLESTRSADERLMTLFADVRPGPAFEHRMVRALSLTALRTFATPARGVKGIMAAAAAVLVAIRCAS